MRRLLKRIGVTIAGFGVVGLGIVLLPLPGPGLLVVVAGLAILATEYAWARRALQEARDRARQASAASVQNTLSTVLTVLGGLGLVGLGVAVIVVPQIPLASVPAGIGLIFGGLAVLVGTVLSYREARRLVR